MAESTHKLSFKVSARRQDAHGSEASCKSASIILDTDLEGRVDAFNPAELLREAGIIALNRRFDKIG